MDGIKVPGLRIEDKEDAAEIGKRGHGGYRKKGCGRYRKRGRGRYSKTGRGRYEKEAEQIQEKGHGTT